MCMRVNGMNKSVFDSYKSAMKVFRKDLTDRIIGLMESHTIEFKDEPIEEGDFDFYVCGIFVEDGNIFFNVRYYSHVDNSVVEELWGLSEFNFRELEEVLKVMIVK